MGMNIDVTCDDCHRVLDSDEEVYCEQCSGKKYDQEPTSDFSLKSKALKNLFSRCLMKDIEDLCGLTQLETMTLRDVCS